MRFAVPGLTFCFTTDASCINERIDPIMGVIRSFPSELRREAIRNGTNPAAGYLIEELGEAGWAGKKAGLRRPNGQSL